MFPAGLAVNSDAGEHGLITHPHPPHITRELLDAARAGDTSALDSLFTLAYEELRQLARRARRGRGSATMNTTALVHEAYVRLASAKRLDVSDAAHFRCLISRCMRQLLVDAARRKQAAKRGGDAVRVTFADDLVGEDVSAARLLDLDSAIEELQAVDPRRASVVECRFFGGLDVEETATALEVSPATVKRDWRVARAWLSQRLDAGE